MPESGLSDHKLIHWAISITRPSTTYTKILRRRWQSFSFEEFINRLKASQLCQPVDPGRTATDLADCYYSEITKILDDLAPVAEMSVRIRPNRPFTTLTVDSHDEKRDASKEHIAGRGRRMASQLRTVLGAQLSQLADAL